MDGNGTIDCPYDFVDATNHSSGTRTTGSSTPGDGSEDGYQEGYADGYKKGEKKGQETGYADGAADAQKDYEKRLLQLEEEHAEELHDMVTPLLWISGLFIVLFLGSVLLSRLGDKQFAAKLKQAEVNYTKRIERLTSDHSAQITKLESDHAAEIQRLKLRNINFRRLEVLERIAQSKDDSIKLPEGVALRPSYTPIRGKTSKRYPYGSYSVFTAYIGKVYHCKHDCAPSARPIHFFDLPDGASPCRKCVPPDMRPQPLPDWYIQLREKLDAIVSDSGESSQAADHMQYTDEPRIQFSLK